MSIIFRDVGVMILAILIVLPMHQAAGMDVSITSPQNITYMDQVIGLNWTSNETADWMYYSINGGSNMTATGWGTWQANSSAYTNGTWYDDYPENQSYDGDWDTWASSKYDWTGQCGIWQNYTISWTDALKVRLKGQNWFNSGFLFYMFNYTLGGWDMIYSNTEAINQVPFEEEIDVDAGSFFSPGNPVRIRTVLNDTNMTGYSSLFETSIMAKTSGPFNTTITPQLGSNCVTVWANSTSGDMGSSTVCFTYDDGVAPNITVSSPVPGAGYTNETVDLNVSADKSVDSWWYSLNNGSIIFFSPNTNITSFLEGANSLDIWTNSTSGNISHKLIAPFYIDLIPPRITVSSPQNKTYSTTENITLITSSIDSINIDNWWYSLNNGSNVTFVSPIVITAQNNSNSILVCANDTVSRINCTSVIFTVTDTCSDNTFYGSCSATVPLFCSNGTLVSNCTLCGCPSGQECAGDGTCDVITTAPPPPPSPPSPPPSGGGGSYTPPCAENWTCTDWSDCINGTITRECNDTNNCGKLLSKPNETESCTIQVNATDIPCTPSKRKCDGNRISVCSGTGEYWVKMDACETGCLDGFCIGQDDNETIKNETVIQKGDAMTGMITAVDSSFITIVFVMVTLISGVSYFFTRSKF